eukprot:TRINITY_DN2010_c0_g1_i1.p1 TRINITY_DN2010_c0_g1~~TRINITY_DN2010_c0_g1_i1.p1  ORF type:complete len:491 (+),score=94.53 TRINITY_DN2010_c0_g1_i1:79-1551(+)
MPLATAIDPSSGCQYWYNSRTGCTAWTKEEVLDSEDDPDAPVIDLSQADPKKDGTNVATCGIAPGGVSDCPAKWGPDTTCESSPDRLPERSPDREPVSVAAREHNKDKRSRHDKKDKKDKRDKKRKKARKKEMKERDARDADEARALEADRLYDVGGVDQALDIAAAIAEKKRKLMGAKAELEVFPGYSGSSDDESHQSGQAVLAEAFDSDRDGTDEDGYPPGFAPDDIKQAQQLSERGGPSLLEELKWKAAYSNGPLPEPDPTAKLQLVQIDSSETDPIRIDIGDVVTVGRSRQNTVQLQDLQVSKEHIRLSRGRDGKVQVSDLGSKHGTTLNGLELAPNTPRIVDPGDVLAVATVGFRLEEVDPADVSDSEEELPQGSAAERMRAEKRRLMMRTLGVSSLKDASAHPHPQGHRNRAKERRLRDKHCTTGTRVEPTVPVVLQSSYSARLERRKPHAAVDSSAGQQSGLALCSVSRPLGDRPGLGFHTGT